MPASSPDTDTDAAKGDLDVSGPLRILGHRRGTKIDARGNDRHFEIFAGPLTLRRLVLVGGRTPAEGGSVALRAGRARLIDVRMRKNRADASGGSLYVGEETRATLKRTQIARSDSSDGGGMYVDGVLDGARAQIEYNTALSSGGGVRVGREAELRLDRSLIGGNKAGGSGGGLYAHFESFARLRRSEILGNEALGDGGGVYVFAARVEISASTLALNASDHWGGGAITAVSGSVNPELRIVNSTVSGNVAGRDNVNAGGGGLSLTSTGTKVILHSTIAGNRAGHGGGIAGPFSASNDPIIMRGSIIAANRATAGPENDCYSVQPSTSEGFNLFGTLDGCNLAPQESDIVGEKPRLGRLRDNGGPTQTRALRKGSPAINKGPQDAPGRDQRGRKRRGRPDIGAFEFHPQRKARKRR